jgi:methylated-DNA-protein-cysteine methyltransferase-like protein
MPRGRFIDPKLLDAQLTRRILKDGLKPNEQRDESIRRVIRSIPRGKVSTYGAVAAAAGYPLYHRLVAKLLRGCGDTLPWPRVVGSGGLIKLKGPAALEQRLRLESEGIRFKGKAVDMSIHEHQFKMWEED